MGRYSDVKAWTKLEHTKLFVEDDSGTYDAEYLDHACIRLFDKTLHKMQQTAIDEDDWGDAVYYLLPDNIVLVVSYPGNSEIRKLSNY